MAVLVSICRDADVDEDVSGFQYRCVVGNPDNEKKVFFYGI